MLHLRCEISDERVLELFEPYAHDPLVRLVSVMDHTPGQRQWSDIAKWRLFHSDKKWTDRDFEEIIRERKRVQELHAEEHRRKILEDCRKRHLPIASHDDTTEQHTIESMRDGITISEFPTTMIAARKAKELGLRVVMGAPNVVRGSSHSGNVSALDLAEQGLLDALSSDYYPLSLLHAPFVLHRRLDIPIPEAVAKVSSNTASLLGLEDRGQVKPGNRADLVQVTVCEDLPVARAAWRNGRKIY
jgi:alpha-D-ribose 1-methylphosphonate 5-triphosphate diphosphatase